MPQLIQNSFREVCLPFYVYDSLFLIFRSVQNYDNKVSVLVFQITDMQKSNNFVDDTTESSKEF